MKRNTSRSRSSSRAAGQLPQLQNVAQVAVPLADTGTSAYNILETM